MGYMTVIASDTKSYIFSFILLLSMCLLHLESLTDILAFQVYMYLMNFIHRKSLNQQMSLFADLYLSFRLVSNTDIRITNFRSLIIQWIIENIH